MNVVHEEKGEPRIISGFLVCFFFLICFCLFFLETRDREECG